MVRHLSLEQTSRVRITPPHPVLARSASGKQTDSLSVNADSISARATNGGECKESSRRAFNPPLARASRAAATKDFA